MSYGIIDVGGGPKGEAGTLRYDVWLERVVRPFESPRILALRARRKARDEDTSDDSLIRWGKPSSYGNAQQTKEEDERGFRVTFPSAKQDPAKRKKETRVYTEVTRESDTVRVSNPNDAEQYVDVQRIKSITFRGPDGVDVRFDLNPPPGTPVPA